MPTFYGKTSGDIIQDLDVDVSKVCLNSNNP